MDDAQRAFLDDLLSTPSPAGYERDGQAVWTAYVEGVADDVWTDDYGSAVGVVRGDGPTVAVAGHADEIGLIVRRIDDGGFVHPGAIGSVDPTTVRGRQVTIHGASGPVGGVVGQTPVHLRDERFDEREVAELRIDVGAADGDEAREVVEVGDPITVDSPARELLGDRIAGRGMDNRVGGWVAAESLRRAAERGVDATVYAVNTVQEEVSKLGARTVGSDLAPDATFVVDVTFTADHPSSYPEKGGDVRLGDGPVVTRGSVNHPRLVSVLREAAAAAGIETQLETTGNVPGTDTEVVAGRGGGRPAALVSVPSRYMHTPVEVVDTADLDATADLLAATAGRVAAEWG